MMNLSSTEVQGKVQAQKISLIPATPSHIFYNPDKLNNSLLFRQNVFFPPLSIRSCFSRPALVC